MASDVPRVLRAAARTLMVAAVDYVEAVEAEGGRADGWIDALGALERAIGGHAAGHAVPISSRSSTAVFDGGVALLLTYAEAADELGVSVRTVKRRVADGVLPTVLEGGKPRVRRRDLEDYVDGLRGSFRDRTETKGPPAGRRDAAAAPRADVRGEVA